MSSELSEGICPKFKLNFEIHTKDNTHTVHTVKCYGDPKEDSQMLINRKTDCIERGGKTAGQAPVRRRTQIELYPVMEVDRHALLRLLEEVITSVQGFAD